MATVPEQIRSTERDISLTKTTILEIKSEITSDEYRLLNSINKIEAIKHLIGAKTKNFGNVCHREYLRKQVEILRLEQLKIVQSMTNLKTNLKSKNEKLETTMKKLQEYIIKRRQLEREREDHNFKR
jgi:chromosome segregation ATPase